MDAVKEDMTAVEMTGGRRLGQMEMGTPLWRHLTGETKIRIFTIDGATQSSHPYFRPLAFCVHHKHGRRMGSASFHN